MEQHLVFPHTNYGGGRDADDDDVLKYLNFSDDDCAETLPLPPPPPPPTTAAPRLAFPATPDDDDDFDMSLLDCVDDGDMQLWDDIIAAGGADGDATLMIEGPPAAAVSASADQYGLPERSAGLDDAASPVWAPAEHLDCSCCHLLRLVVHSDGHRSMKLALHGGLGVFYHAILDVYYGIEGLSTPAVEQSYIDLRGQNLEWVKQFLMNYGLLRYQERYLILEDSLSTFYDALCVSMSYQEERASVSQAPPPAPPQPRPPPPSMLQPVGVSKQAEMESSNLMAKSRVRIAAQRERTKRLHLKDLASYVHLPITEAAKKLQICPTALKKVCRKHGIHRWPYRKVRSLDREISSLQKELRSATREEASSAQAKIEKLRAERARVCAGLPPPQ